MVMGVRCGRRWKWRRRKRQKGPDEMVEVGRDRRGRQNRHRQGTSAESRAGDRGCSGSGCTAKSSRGKAPVVGSRLLRATRRVEVSRPIEWLTGFYCAKPMHALAAEREKNEYCWMKKKTTQRGRSRDILATSKARRSRCDPCFWIYDQALSTTSTARFDTTLQSSDWQCDEKPAIEGLSVLRIIRNSTKKKPALTGQASMKPSPGR
ncbi:hypothetical protein QBC35DRAFT_35677 [Podospora australis]|uniref:Uncharacterized protein n=1 Tax=Podospora australis TaxID=1536484 RepID=A0AAN7AM27_9PEZI|nr:hypothetical protein QBC35DRAFT_35677 [Podospora australis]